MGWRTQLGTALAVLAGSWLALHSAGARLQFEAALPPGASAVPSNDSMASPAADQRASTSPTHDSITSAQPADAQFAELSAVVTRLMHDVAELKVELQSAVDNQAQLLGTELTKATTAVSPPVTPPTPEALQQQLATQSTKEAAATRFVAQTPDLAVEATVQAGWNQLQAELVDAEFPEFTVDALNCGSTLCKVNFGHNNMDQGIIELLLSSIGNLGVESLELDDRSGTAYLATASSGPRAMGVH